MDTLTVIMIVVVGVLALMVVVSNVRRIQRRREIARGEAEPETE